MKAKTLLTSIVLFLMTFLPTLQAAEIVSNGEKLMNSCKVALEYLNSDQASDNMDEVIYCDDYLTGFREDENIKEIYMPGNYYRGYCLPDSGVTNAELARVIVAFLEANKHEQELAANTAVRDALVNGYPCR